MDDHQTIVRPLHTEKSVADIRENNAYHFEVHPRATKGQIRHAIEEMFPGRRVVDVRTMNMKGKTRRRGRTIGKTRDWKKAVVRLREGDTIDIGY
jgi:large subunit ribosomal protein L23